VRAQESVALRGEDIELKTGAVYIRQGKGAKDRIVYLGAKSLRALLRYYMQRGVPAPGAAVWVGERAPHAPLIYYGLAQHLLRIGVVDNL
jgi:integrase